MHTPKYTLAKRENWYAERALHPKNEYTPKRITDQEVQKLKIGDYTKVCILAGWKAETIWVTIKEANYPNFKGEISNDLVHSFQHRLFNGDVIEFVADEIISGTLPDADTTLPGGGNLIYLGSRHRN